MPAYDPQNWKHSQERFLFEVSAREKQAIDAHNAEVDRQVAEVRKQIGALRGPDPGSGETVSANAPALVSISSVSFVSSRR